MSPIVDAGLAVAATPPVPTCLSVPNARTLDIAPGLQMQVRTVGQGKPVLYIPSLGRKAGDFDDVAKQMAAKGYMAILPEPRGAGGSAGPKPASLFDLAHDYQVVLTKLCQGKVDVVGHAFGNRVARALATSAPDRVDRVALLAGGGEVQPTDQVRNALQGSLAEGEKPNEERLKDLQVAFFAKGADPSVWLTGWVPAMARAQSAAGRATPTKAWWTAGQAQVLLVQALEDPIAPPGNGAALKRDIGERLTLVTLPHASHAILPEQPQAVASVLAAWFGGERSEQKLQGVINAEIRQPG